MRLIVMQDKKDETFYGTFEQTALTSEIDFHVEEIMQKGYTILKNLLDQESLPRWRKMIDETYQRQENAFGKEQLTAIQELDVCRAPILYDRHFIDLAENDTVIAIVKQILGEWFILNLQNAIINRPGTIHHQSSWHRDFPHQNFVISRPIGINALYAIDDFNENTGGTMLLPFSHKSEKIPSINYMAENSITANAPAGSVILFDVMLFHKAGKNSSNIIRRSVNHLYTIPIIKQQYDFPRALADSCDDLPDHSKRLLGFTSQVPLNDQIWRNERAARIQPDK